MLPCYRAGATIPVSPAIVTYPRDQSVVLQEICSYFLMHRIRIVPVHVAVHMHRGGVDRQKFFSESKCRQCVSCGCPQGQGCLRQLTPDHGICLVKWEAYMPCFLPIHRAGASQVSCRATPAWVMPGIARSADRHAECTDSPRAVIWPCRGRRIHGTGEGIPGAGQRSSVIRGAPCRE